MCVYIEYCVRERKKRPINYNSESEMSGSLYENLTLHIAFYWMFYTKEAVPLFLTLRLPASLQYFQY